MCNQERATVTAIIACFLLFVAGVTLMAYSGNQIIAEKDWVSRSFVPAHLLRLDGDTYLANSTTTFALNCTLRLEEAAEDDFPVVAEGYMYKGCWTFMGAEDCYCLLERPTPAASLERMMWAGMGLVIFCIVFFLVERIKRKCC